jgi:hypothetical protein
LREGEEKGKNSESFEWGGERECGTIVEFNAPSSQPHSQGDLTVKELREGDEKVKNSESFKWGGERECGTIVEFHALK